MKTITQQIESQVEELTTICGVTYNTKNSTFGTWEAEDGYHYKIIVTNGSMKGQLISTWLGGYPTPESRDKALQENVGKVDADQIN